jgi:hypothetical protein
MSKPEVSPGGNYWLSGIFSAILAILQKNDPQHAPRIDDLPFTNSWGYPPIQLIVLAMGTNLNDQPSTLWQLLLTRSP